LLFDGRRKMREAVNNEYRNVLRDIITEIKRSRLKMLTNVNKETVRLYWHIGSNVFERIKQNDWGKSVVEKLAKDLQLEFPGVRGFSARNIWRMKVFYETYSNFEILPPAVAEIGWSQNYLIIEKCKDDNERRFYLTQIKKNGKLEELLNKDRNKKSYEVW